MKKKLLLTGGVIFSIYVFVSMVFAKEGYSLNYLETARKAFQASGAEKYELNIQGWGQLNQEFLNEETLIAEADKITTLLNLPIEKAIKNTEEGFNSITIVHQDDNSNQLYFTLQTYAEDYMTQATYLGICYTTSDENLSGEWYERIERVFRNKNIKPDMNATLVGTFAGMMNKKEKQEIISQAMLQTNSFPVEGIVTEELVSISGLSNLTKETLTVGLNKININMALRYHDVDNKTYLYIGAPIIQIDY